MNSLVGMRASVAPLAFAIALMASACDGAAKVCTGVGVVGIDLHVVSRATGASLDQQAIVKVVALQAPFDSATGHLLGERLDTIESAVNSDTLFTRAKGYVQLTRLRNEGFDFSAAIDVPDTSKKWPVWLPESGTWYSYVFVAKGIIPQDSISC